MHPRPVTLVVASVAFAFGCKDSPKATGQKGATGTTDKAGASTAPPTSAPSSDRALLPGDAKVVLGVDWQQLQAHSLWKQLALPALMKEREVVTFVTEIKNRCGIDLATDPKHITIGVKGIEADRPDGGAVVTGLDKAKTLACAGTFKVEAEKEGTAIKTEGDVVLALDRDGYGAGVTFVGDRALFLIGESMSTGRFKEAIAGAYPLAHPKGLMDMHGKLDTKQTGWGFFRGPTMEKEVSEIIGSTPKAVYGSVGTANGVSAQVRARLDSPETATKTVAAIREQVERAAGQLDKADIAADGQDVRLDIAAAGAKLDALVGLMREE